MSSRGWVCLLLILVACAPGAAAQSVGDFVGRGELQLSGPSEMTLDARGLYLADASNLTALALHATAARVHIFELTFNAANAAGYRVQFVPPERHEASYALTDVRVTMEASERGGEFGVFAGESAVVAAAPESTPLLRAAEATHLGRRIGDLGQGPGALGYALDVTEPHLYAQADGKAVVTGPMTIRFDGPDFWLSAASNVTYQETGQWTDSDAAVQQVTHRWVVLEVEDGVLELAAAAPLEMVASTGAVSIDGSIGFVAVSGAIQTPRGTYRATAGEPAFVSGDLRADVSPYATEDQLFTRIRMSGSVSTTSLALAPVSNTGLGRLPVVPALALLGAVAAVVGAGVGYAFRGRHKRAAADKVAYTPDDYLAFANLAAEDERYGEALEWLAKAKAAAPGSTRILLDEAFYLSALGDVEGALASYAEASRRSNDGEADFLAGMLLREIGAPMREITTHLERALERTPTLALEFEPASTEHAPLFHDVRFTRAYERAMRRARS